MRGGAGRVLKPILLARNLTLNSDAALNYKHTCGPYTGLLPICEISQWNTYDQKHCGETKQRAQWWHEARTQENQKIWPRWARPQTFITKTYLYNFDPLKPHFYIVKLGFTGVYIIFHISAQNVDCGYSLDPPRRGGSNEYPQSMFWAEIWKMSEFFIWKFSFFGGKILSIFE